LPEVAEPAYLIGFPISRWLHVCRGLRRSQPSEPQSDDIGCYGLQGVAESA
jgi:hypothetical protein